MSKAAVIAGSKLKLLSVYFSLMMSCNILNIPVIPFKFGLYFADILAHFILLLFSTKVLTDNFTTMTTYISILQSLF